MTEIKNKRFKPDLLYKIKLFFLILVPLILIMLFLSGIVYYFEYKTDRELIISQESDRVDLMQREVEYFFDAVSSDLHILSNHQELFFYINTKDDIHRQRLAKEFLAFSENREIYDQIRLIDNNGKEVIRINYNKGNPVIVPDYLLQDKSKRYYFEDTISLNRDEIFVSPMDLNIENGLIETPIKPTIRFGIPIFDVNDDRVGVIILNVFGDNLINKLQSLYLGNDISAFMLVNSDGYWLHGINPNEEWGFMYEGREDIKFSNKYPDIWKNIENQNYFINKEAFFITRKITPLSLAQKSSTGSIIPRSPSLKKINAENYYWLVISFIPLDIVYASANQLLTNLVIFNLLVFIIFIAGAWYLVNLNILRIRNIELISNLNDVLEIVNKILRHDILNKIVGVKALIDSFNKRGNKENLKLAEENLDSGISLIKKMKELESLTKSGGSLKVYNVKEVLADMVKNYQIPIEIDGDCTVFADTALESVFDNIIRNAIMHSKTDKIKISITPEDNLCKIKISDFGIGIPDSIKDKIFEEGYKGEDTGNTGLGLYIVKKTVERYGGKIWVEDNKPRGAKFVMQLHK